MRSRGSDSAAPAQEGSRGRWASIHERLAALKPTGRQQKVQSSWSYPRIRQLPGRPRSRTRLRNERNALRAGARHGPGSAYSWAPRSVTRKSHTIGVGRRARTGLEASDEGTSHESSCPRRAHTSRSPSSRAAVPAPRSTTGPEGRDIRLGSVERNPQVLQPERSRHDMTARQAKPGSTDASLTCCTAHPITVT